MMSPRTPLSRSLLGLTGVGAALVLVACSADPVGNDAQTAAPASYPMTVDNCGEELILDSEPRTIFAIGTSAIALLDTAGASDRITARAGEFGADLSADLENPPTSAPIIDPFDPTIENIVGVEPDIIIGYGLFNASEDDVAAVGIPSVIIDGECSHDAALTDRTDFNAIFADVERLATIFGTQDVADERLGELRAELDQLGSATVDRAANRSAAVVYYFSENATMSARGGQGIAHDVLSRAGFENVYGDEPSVYLEASIETLLDADPHTIVLAYGLYGESFDDAREVFLAEPGVSDLIAVQENRVVGVLAGDLAPDPGALRGLRAVLDGTGALAE